MNILSWRISSRISRTSGRRCFCTGDVLKEKASSSLEAIRKGVAHNKVFLEVKNTIWHQNFGIGAAAGFGFGILFYLRERNLSVYARLKRSGNYMGLVEYWREKGRVTKAFGILQRAAKDDPKALIELGHVYASGEGTKLNLAKALECYKEAYEKGESAYSYAVAVLEGNGCAKFPEKAFGLFVKAAMQGDLRACLTLSKMYKDDTPLGNSRLRSLYYARLGAQRGCVEGEHEYKRYSMDAGNVIINSELDEIAEQIGSAELTAISEIISRARENRFSGESRLEEVHDQVARLQQNEMVDVEKISEGNLDEEVR